METPPSLIKLKQFSLTSGKKPMLRLSQCWEHKVQHSLKAEGTGQTQTVIYRRGGPDAGLNKRGFKDAQRDFLIVSGHDWLFEILFF